MRQWTVDAFAAEAFKGNQACVVEPFSAWPDDAWMQSLAAENNQAETAFLLKTDQPDRFGLRWFTPKLEVPLCGHATLASAHVLFDELELGADAIVFETRVSGHLIVYRKGALYEMDFPADPPKRTDVPAGLAQALGAEPKEVWAGAYLVALYDDAKIVRGLAPNIAALEPIAGEATGGRGNICVAAPSDDPDYDVIDRFFAPGSGIPEDPATGSMHCILGPLFAGKLGKAEVKFHQAYPGRGADIATELRADRIRLKGRARTMLEGRLRL
ncbi:MAG TPA: PhzF family phenazine biosynthesis protein [Caulobacteraceae bacterium]|nr:PhzF family phenazine biosynthesis protein [Caulobacteraceae bacterium]